MKKTNKENPITFFRKANEARQKTVKKSLKKAQDGIEMNDDLINKPGYSVGKSKEGFKNYTTPRIETQSISPDDPYEKYKAVLNSQNANAMNINQGLQSRAAALQTNERANAFMGKAARSPANSLSSAYHKKGGSTKRKK